MYQPKVRNPLSPFAAREPDDIDAAMWALFVAIGDFWKTGDGPDRYRLRFRSFMQNRIALNPLYQKFYAAAKTLIDELVSRLGESAAYEDLFTQKDRRSPPAPPETEREFIQSYVVNEFIALRLALGSFQTFGAANYCGYFGGANIDDQPPPYRTRDP
jgi:hypothetical protein